MLLCKNDPELFTHTTEGRVPHLFAKIGGYDLSMPVRVKKTKSNSGAVEPERDEFGYVYALPAGRKISLNGDIK